MCRDASPTPVKRIATCTSEFIHDAETEIERHRIPHAKHVKDLKQSKYKLMAKINAKNVVPVYVISCELLWKRNPRKVI